MPTFFEIGQWGFQKDLKQILEKISQKRERDFVFINYIQNMNATVISLVGFCTIKFYAK